MEFLTEKKLSCASQTDLKLQMNYNRNVGKSEVQDILNQSLSLSKAIMLSLNSESWAVQDSSGFLRESSSVKVPAPTHQEQQQAKNAKASAVPLPSGGNKKSARTKRVRKWTKPKDKPKRPLSAYNLFYRDQREVMLHDKKTNKNGNGTNKKGLGFGGMAKEISVKWNLLGEAARAPYEGQARLLRKKYFEAVEEWKKKRKGKTAEGRDSYGDDTEKPKSSALLDSLVVITSSDQKCHPFMTAEQPLSSPGLPSHGGRGHIIEDDEPIPYTASSGGSNACSHYSDPVLDSIVEALDIDSLFWSDTAV